MIDASFDVLLDYHDCPACGVGQLIETRCTDSRHGATCPDRACLTCGTAFFLDPDLIWPTADRADGNLVARDHEATA